MSGQTKSWLIVASVVAGGVLGVTIALFAVRAGDAARAADARRSLERRLSELENREQEPVYVPVPVPAPARDPSPGPPLNQLVAAEDEARPPPDTSSAALRRDEEHEELTRREARAIEEHRLAPQDRDWAARVTPSLRADLESASKSMRFRLGEVDCRSTSCLVELEWPGSKEASDEFANVAHEPLDVNCARSITLPESSAPGTPVRATMILDCKDWKSNGSNLVSQRVARQER